MNQNARMLLLYSFLVRFTKQTSEPRNERSLICAERDNQLRPYEFLYYSHMSEEQRRRKIVYTRQHAISGAFFCCSLLLLQHSSLTLDSSHSLLSHSCALYSRSLAHTAAHSLFFLYFVNSAGLLIPRAAL